jgi:hypothetical protein
MKSALLLRIGEHLCCQLPEGTDFLNDEQLSRAFIRTAEKQKADPVKVRPRLVLDGG